MRRLQPSNDRGLSPVFSKGLNTMRSRWSALVLLIAISTWTAVAELQVGLRYNFEVGAKTEVHLTTSIDNVEMGTGVPLAVTGSAEADVTIEVASVDEEEGIATLRVTFGDFSAQLLGEAQEGNTPEPVELRVDGQGHLIDAGGMPAPDMDLFSGGGIPVQMVVLLAGVVEFPEAPVAVGERWTSEYTQTVPELGDVTVTTSSRLENLDDAAATFVTNISASFPDFTTPNPLQAGDITITNGLLSVEDMRRTLDVTTGLVTSAQGIMTFDCMAAVGGFADMPLTVTTSFSIKPRAEEGEEDAQKEARAQPEPQPRAPGHPTGEPENTGKWLVRVLSGYLVRAIEIVRGAQERL